MRSSSLFAKKTFLQPISLARIFISSVTLSQYVINIFSHSKSFAQIFFVNLQTAPKWTTSIRSRNEAIWTRTRGGSRISQSPQTIAWTCLSVSSPNTRLMSLWRRASSSNSSRETFFWLGGNPRWSLRIAIRHVRQITSLSFTTSWWKSLLGAGAWPTFSMKTFKVLIVYNSWREMRWTKFVPRFKTWKIWNKPGRTCRKLVASLLQLLVLAGKFNQ